MQQLSNLDSTFLSLESYRTPMHIGCIWTFEAPKSGDMTFHRFRQHIESRLPISPVFRRRLSSFILDIDRPYWIEDSQFDLKNHLNMFTCTVKIRTVSAQTSLIIFSVKF